MLDVAATTPKRGTERGVMVCEIKYGLRKTSSLHYAANLDRTLIFDEFTHGVQQSRRKLRQHVSFSYIDFRLLIRSNSPRNTNGTAMQSA